MLLVCRSFHSAIAAVFLSVAAASAAPVQEPAPSAVKIFDAALAKFEADRVALRKWQYHQTVTTHQFDRSGKVVAKGTWRSIVRPGDPRPLEYTSESMEGKLSFFKAGTEEAASAVESPAAEKRKAAQREEEKNQAESAIEAVRKYNLRDRYEWKLAGVENVGGESAYLITFEPNPHQNTSSREERFFGQLAGRLSVSRNDYSVLKARAALQAPAQLFWIIARVTKFRVTYDLEPTAGGNPLLRNSKATATTEVAFPFYVVRQQHWLTADHFEPRTPRGTAKAIRRTSPSPTPRGTATPVRSP